MKQQLSVINAYAASDGDGVKISRIAGGRFNALLDPFLLLDQINSDAAADYIGGFPAHPHRGFETITYMKAGRMRHRDHMGNEGVIAPGDVQWMTAGSGVIHSEMPEQDNGLLHGFQLWLNLPAAEKMRPAAYAEINSASIPEINGDGASLRLIAGDITIENRSYTGVLPARATTPLLADVQLVPGAALSLDSGLEKLLVYVYQGSIQGLEAGQLGIYTGAGSLALVAAAEGAQLLVLGGTVLREPIVQHGPFVMNTREQIEQALQDYRDGRLVAS